MNLIFRLANRLWKCQNYDKGIYHLVILRSEGESPGVWCSEQYLSRVEK